MIRLFRMALAWGVHFYTALGLVCAAGMAVLIVGGDSESLHLVWWLMVLATLIDATDGALARLFRVADVLPEFDGRRLDDLVDFQTYVAMPLLLLWRLKSMPAGGEVCLLLPLVAAAWGFSQTQAKTEDGFFRGFPSCWNVVAFYLHFLPWEPLWRLVAIVILSVLTFVPLKYPYPSQPGGVNRFTLLLAVPWVVLVMLTLWWADTAPNASLVSAAMSLVFAVWYLAAPWWLFWRTR